MGKKYELLQNGETPTKPVPRIHRSFTNKDIQSNETTSSSSSAVDNKPVQPITPVTVSNAQQINDKHKKLDDSHPRFGPLFQQQRDMTEEARKLHHAAKNKAWEHVMNARLERPDPEETKEAILHAMRNVEMEARQEYAANSFSGMDSDFRMMMIKDGCLFIHMAFMILGKFHKAILLDNPIFGGNRDVNNISSVWMEAMFYVGNQIPLVVLRVLIKQQFFQDWIREENWNPPVLDLRKLVLYEELILPELDNTKYKDQLGRLGDKAEKKPCDVLHALHNLVLGPTLTDPSNDYKFGEYEGPLEFDLEANEEDAIVEENKFLSAVELKQVGIYIKKLKSGGPRSIRFSSWYFWAYLYLPVFPVDDDIISVFRSLKTYEISNQQLGKRNRELSSYISLMSDIIQTPQDLCILHNKGIVGEHPNMETLPGILRKLNSKDVKLTYALRNVRRLITNFSSPLIRYQTIINFVVFLTTIQAVFTMLAYFKPPKAPS